MGFEDLHVPLVERVTLAVGNTPSPRDLEVGQEVNVRRGGGWIRVIVTRVVEWAKGRFRVFWTSKDGETEGESRHTKVREVE